MHTLSLIAVAFAGLFIGTLIGYGTAYKAIADVVGEICKASIEKGKQTNSTNAER